MSEFTNQSAKHIRAMAVPASQRAMLAVQILAYAEKVDTFYHKNDHIYHLFFLPHTAVFDVNENLEDLCNDEVWPDRRTHLVRLRSLAEVAIETGCQLLILEENSGSID